MRRHFKIAVPRRASTLTGITTRRMTKCSVAGWSVGKGQARVTTARASVHGQRRNTTDQHEHTHVEEARVRWASEAEDRGIYLIE